MRADKSVGSHAGLIAFSLLCVAFTGVCEAQDVSLEDQYKKKLASVRQVTPVTEFGDQISLRDGSLTFKNTDVELQGIGPAIRVIRTAVVNDNRISKLPTANTFGAWDLEVPRIKTVTANGSNYDRGSTMSPSSPVGWQVAAPDKNARCTNFTSPGDVTYEDRSVEFFAQDWWFGYYLVDGDGDEHKLLQRSSNLSLPAPQHKIGTKSGWIVDCLATTSNGEPGEAFIATSPDGTRYWFDHLTYTDIPGFVMAFEDMPPKGYTLSFTLHRRAAAMLVSRIEDRFGNWLRYSYVGGRLSEINASDGRRLIVEGSGGITRISTGTGRAWKYEYADASQAELSSVTLPDGSSWRYQGDFHGSLFSKNPFRGCDQDYPDSADYRSRSVYVSTPSGATARFNLSDRAFGRSYVSKHCILSIYKPAVVYNPKLYWSLALNEKIISGPSLGATWKYTYSDPNGSYSSDCVSSACKTSVWTDVEDPSGAKIRHVFSNKSDQIENSLIRQEFYDAPGNLIRARDLKYAVLLEGSSSYPWPYRIGSSPDDSGNYLVNERLSPVESEVIVEAGAEFARKVNSFDAWGRALSQTYYSPWHSRTDVVEYRDDISKWVLGQFVSSTNLNAGLTEKKIAYSDNAQPLTVEMFGRLAQTLTYNSDGTVATVRDGDNNATTFSSWKRGIAQRVEHADGTSASAVVNDDGWIASVTDENGFVTSYTYDAMGRLNSTTYPSGDSTTWDPTVQEFQPVSTAEYGVAAGHWRQTVATGNARKVTYFDALWRPLLTREYDASNATETQRFQRFAYDFDGRVIFASYHGGSDVLNEGTWTEYDALGRITSSSMDSELGVLTTLTEYLPGNQTQVTDAHGNKTISGYQVFDQPVYDRPVWILHPEGGRTEIARDVFGNVTQITRISH